LKGLALLCSTARNTLQSAEYVCTVPVQKDGAGEEIFGVDLLIAPRLALRASMELACVSSAAIVDA
jgi:hypothetical protein